MDTLALQHKRLLRVDEVAKILNVSRWTVYRWVEAGRLGGTRIGAGSLRIFSDTVTGLIDHHCVGVSPAAVVSAGVLDRRKTEKRPMVPPASLRSRTHAAR
jgi:excisionase family DNA binding protein